MSILYTSGRPPFQGGDLEPLLSLRRPEQREAVSALQEDSVVYSCLPLFHANASMAALGTMVAEGTFAMGKRFSLTTFWDEIRSMGQRIRMSWDPSLRLLARQPRKEDDVRNPLK